MNVYAKAFSEQKQAAMICLPGANFAADIFSFVNRPTELVKSADANDAKCERQRYVNVVYSGQLEGQAGDAEEGPKTFILGEEQGFFEMGKAGVEPATHGFSVRCSTN